MKISKLNLSLGLVCFLLGGSSTWIAQKLLSVHHAHDELAQSRLRFKSDTPVKPYSFMGSANESGLDPFFDDDFLNPDHDPFKQLSQMGRLRSHLLRQFDQPMMAGGGVGEVKKREDKDYVYYDVAIKGLDKRDFNFKIAEGQISISGQLKKKSEDGDGGTFFSSSFQRSFPVPPDVDAKRVQIEQDQDRLTLKFPRSV